MNRIKYNIAKRYIDTKAKITIFYDDGTSETSSIAPTQLGIIKYNYKTFNDIDGVQHVKKVINYTIELYKWNLVETSDYINIIKDIKDIEQFDYQIRYSKDTNNKILNMIIFNDNIEECYVFNFETLTVSIDDKIVYNMSDYLIHNNYATPYGKYTSEQVYEIMAN